MEDEAYNPLQWESFVVRFWREAAGGQWRGQITHAPGREQQYFTTLAQLEAFLARFVDGLPTGPTQTPDK
ncbi:MAG: hypothetical protein KDE29_23145 [Anaerolineales bacterium]|nr:hypothetical protein [Anaerolineales bacterium]